MKWLFKKMARCEYCGAKFVPTIRGGHVKRFCSYHHQKKAAAQRRTNE